MGRRKRASTPVRRDLPRPRTRVRYPSFRTSSHRSRPPSGSCPTTWPAWRACAAGARRRHHRRQPRGRRNRRTSTSTSRASRTRAYGAQIMENLGECTGGDGQYVQFVGSTDHGSHMEWVRRRLRQAAGRLPRHDPRRGPDRVARRARRSRTTRPRRSSPSTRTSRHFRARPGTDVVGIARAVEEAGKADTTCVMGTSIPSVAGRLPRQRSDRQDLLLGPGHGRQGTVAVAKILAEGGTIEEGTDLGIPGYESLVKLDRARQRVRWQCWRRG